jgi:hypothetical protein
MQPARRIACSLNIPEQPGRFLTQPTRRNYVHGRRTTDGTCHVTCGGTRSTLTDAVLHVRRVKNGTLPILGDDLRAPRRLQRDPKSPFMLTSERGAPFSPIGFSRIVERAGASAELGYPVARPQCYAPRLWRFLVLN